MKEKKTTVFRNMLNQPGAIVMPGVYDALSGKMAERAGFKMLAHTGYGVAATLLGEPDVGLVCFREMCDRVKSIARAVEAPLFTDADTGYGNPINVFRTVKEYIWAGSAGLFIEDQVWPKRCGHLTGKQVIDADEMAAKIRAAIDAKNEEDPDFVIGARCDAIATDGFDEAVRRAKKYRDAGADFIFIEAYENLDQMKKAIEEVDAPLLVNLIEGGKTPVVTAKEAEEIGFKLIAFPLTALWATTNALSQVFQSLKETGSAQQYLDKLMTWVEFNEIIGIQRIADMQEKYK